MLKFHTDTAVRCNKCCKQTEGHVELTYDRLAEMFKSWQITFEEVVFPYLMDEASSPEEIDIGYAELLVLFK